MLSINHFLATERLSPALSPLNHRRSTRARLILQKLHYITVFYNSSELLRGQRVSTIVQVHASYVEHNN